MGMQLMEINVTFSKKLNLLHNPGSKIRFFFVKIGKSLSIIRNQKLGGKSKLFCFYKNTKILDGKKSNDLV